VNGIAFTRPADLVGATAPSGYTFQDGGLNSSGCHGSGASFFCFDANTTPATSPALAVNSSLDFMFTETLGSGGSFTGYNPDFKIDWIGNKNNYDLVSQKLTPVLVPAPLIGRDLLVLLAVCGLLAGAGLVGRGKKRLS
jgi:hypothetical protein